ncbi:unannotated protein [freshwater metagenome]|uniref:Unannotated protein n=1 Tax=freshwater metagenome TaxID=449393 RepID=A0A6J7EQN6_9ZZZZ
MPNGTLIAGCPTRLVGIVYVSQRYMASGLSPLDPNSNATVGDVGVSSTSAFAYAAAKSLAMRRRILRALP